MKLLALVLLFLLPSWSCTKENHPYLFTGKVYDNNLNAVPGVTVQLLAYYSGGILGGGGFDMVASKNTNTVGNFSKNFSYTAGPQFFTVRAFSKEYYPFIKEHIQDSLPDKVLTINPVVNKYATLKIIVKNTSPFDNSDIISFGHSYEISAPFDTFIERKLSSGTYNSDFDEYAGTNVKAYELTRTKGDTYTIIQWRTRKNGVSAFLFDSIYIKGGTQATYNLTY